MTAPPLDAVTPHDAQLAVTVVTGAIVAAMFVYALVVWGRRRTPVPLLLLSGATLCAINEVPLDLLGQIYFPRHEAYEAYEAYGRVIPWWVVFAYTIFFGMLSVAMLAWLQRGVTLGRVWTGVGVICLCNALLEVTVLSTDVYFYFGYQPLRIGDFPAVWLAINSLGVLTICVVVRTFAAYFVGRRVMLLVLVPPLCQIFGAWFGTPHYLVLNSDAGHGAKTLAALATMGLCLLVTAALVRFLVEHQTPVHPDRTPVREVSTAPAGAVDRGDVVGATGAGRGRV